MLGEALQDLMQWHSGHSSGGSRCAQVGSLIVKVRRRERPGPLPIHLALVEIIVYKISCMLVRRVMRPMKKDLPSSSSSSSPCTTSA